MLSDSSASRWPELCVLRPIPSRRKGHELSAARDWMPERLTVFESVKAESSAQTSSVNAGAAPKRRYAPSTVATRVPVVSPTRPLRQGVAVWASAADPRITPIGRFMRRTRLDELPKHGKAEVRPSSPRKRDGSHVQARHADLVK